MTHHGADVTAFEAKTRLSELAGFVEEKVRLWDHVTFVFRKA